VFPWDTGGMYTVELYARVRRAVHVDGRSQREVAREFGLARKTVRKMLEYRKRHFLAALFDGCQAIKLDLR